MDNAEPAEDEPTGLLISDTVTAALKTTGTAEVIVLLLTVTAVVAVQDSSSAGVVPGSSGVYVHAPAPSQMVWLVAASPLRSAAAHAAPAGASTRSAFVSSFEPLFSTRFFSIVTELGVTDNTVVPSGANAIEP
jgi:hypothetical protein